jgi:hypothetical protein
MSSLKVWPSFSFGSKLINPQVVFALNFLLESLGLDVGLSRLLLTFLLQYVRTDDSSAPLRSIIDYQTRGSQNRKLTTLACNSCRKLHVDLTPGVQELTSAEAKHVMIHKSQQSKGSLITSPAFQLTETPRMWTRMSQSEEGSGGGIGSVDFLSTHPANAKRIKVGPLFFQHSDLRLSFVSSNWRSGCLRSVTCNACPSIADKHV